MKVETIIVNEVIQIHSHFLSLEMLVLNLQICMFYLEYQEIIKEPLGGVQSRGDIKAQV